MPSLYVVGTPIGNLEDISLRAIRVLKEVSLIASEDTRTTRCLLTHFGIRTPLISYFEHNKSAKLDHLLQALEGGDVALVSEAGMPGISDPGYELVVAAQRLGFSVIPVPGPSAAVTAVAVSGLPTDRFHYLGFLPRRGNARRKFLEDALGQTATLVAYEAPHRLNEALRDIISVLGNRRLAVCRELTKIHEEVFRGTATEALSYFSAPRGEFTLVIAGAEPGTGYVPHTQLSAKIKELIGAGRSVKDAVTEIAAVSGLSRKDLYRLWLETK
ncbi:MAG: 16S rRNA (cytidine(1402)-2'-O)-methyltransferase [Dehalococcoidia bacterium]|nr:16S rRNA (cytidine(1402)-2'-O)-methyltransferase [Dehalococcoidia bacterium]